MAMVTLKNLPLLPVLIAMSFLGACTTVPSPVPVEERSRQADTEAGIPPDEGARAPAEQQPSSPPDTEEAVTGPEYPGAGRHRQQQDSPAIVALLDNADQSMASGNTDRAVASIERALRIDPKNPRLWQHLGRIRLQQKRWDQAIATARKSNLLATDDVRLRADNWLIISRALEGKGDSTGAQHALEQARKLYRQADHSS